MSNNKLHVAIAKNLIQALPYIQKFSGQTIVVKYGGNAMLDESLRASVMTDIVLMRSVRINPIVVHGGGPDVSETMRRMGKEPAFINGLRVTDAETMEIAEMVLAGKTNKNIVAHLNMAGGNAVGLCGKDGKLFMAEKETDKGDLGFVGKIVKVNTDLVTTLTGAGFIPVISSVAMGEDGQTYNINADTAAGALASALGACKLILMTDVQGLYRDFKDKSSLISQLSWQDAVGMIAKDQISHGMIPKVEACGLALQGGTERAHIIDGREPHSILLELFTDQGTGTMVTQ